MNICKDLLGCRDAESNYNEPCINIEKGRFICEGGDCSDKFNLCCFSCLKKTCENPSVDREKITPKNRKLLKEYIMLKRLQGD